MPSRALTQRGARTSPCSIAPPVFRWRRRTREPSCFTASSSARACCFSNAGRASAPSWWRGPPKNCSVSENAAGKRTGRVCSPKARCIQAEPPSRFSLLFTHDLFGKPLRTFPDHALSCALQSLVAFAVIAAALLDPLHAAIAIGRLVGVVLVDAGMHARLAGGFLRVFRIDRRREYRRTSGRGRRGCFPFRFLRGGRCRRSGRRGNWGGVRPPTGFV